MQLYFPIGTLRHVLQGDKFLEATNCDIFDFDKNIVFATNKSFLPKKITRSLPFIFLFHSLPLNRMWEREWSKEWSFVRHLLPPDVKPLIRHLSYPLLASLCGFRKVIAQFTSVVYLATTRYTIESNGKAVIQNNALL